MCNGANLAFRVSTFKEINGYGDQSHLVSGDDQILMSKIESFYPGSVLFNEDPDSVISTETSSSWAEFTQQRIRWAGKWSQDPGVNVVLLGAFIFGFYLLFTISVIWTIVSTGKIVLVLLALGLKVLVDYLFLSSVARTLKL